MAYMSGVVGGVVGSMVHGGSMVDSMVGHRGVVDSMVGHGGSMIGGGNGLVVCRGRGVGRCRGVCRGRSVGGGSVGHSVDVVVAESSELRLSVRQGDKGHKTEGLKIGILFNLGKEE